MRRRAVRPCQRDAQRPAGGCGAVLVYRASVIQRSAVHDLHAKQRTTSRKQLLAMKATCEHRDMQEHTPQVRHRASGSVN